MASEIRVNSLTNRSGLSTVSILDTGAVISGDITAVNGTFSGNVSVAGTFTYEDVTSVDSIGIITARSGIISPYADIDDFVTVGSNIHLGNAGVITATSYRGDGSQLTGISVDSTKIETGNTKVETIDTGSDGHVKITTEGTERLRVTSAGNLGIGGLTSPGALLSIPAGESNTPRLAIESAVDDNDFTITQYEDGNGTYTMLGQNVKLNSGGNNTILDSGHRTAGILLDARNHGAITFLTGGTNSVSEPVKITSAGNVGVNIANPERKLEVVDTAGSLTYPIAVSNHTDASTGVGAAIDFRLASNGVTRGELGLVYAGNSNSDGTDFVFKPNDGSTGNVERLRLTSDGRLRLATDYISQTTFDNSHAYFDFNPTQTTWGSTGNKDVYMRPALVVRTPVRDSINNPAIVIAENGGQATGRNSLAFFNNDFNSGGGYLKARLYTQVGPSYNGTAFYIDVADSSQNIQNRFSIDVNGNFSGSSSGNISDARLKENIQTIQNPIDKIRGLTGRTFTWTDASTRNDGRTHYGFVAQEVDTVVSELVRHDSGLTWFDADDNIVGEFDENIANSSKTVHEQGVIPILVEALKEALDKIDTLEARITTLEG